MKKIIINAGTEGHYGLFLPKEAIELLERILLEKGESFLISGKLCEQMIRDGSVRPIERYDPRLIEVAEKLQLSEKSQEHDACWLKIIEIPEDVDWEISVEGEDGEYHEVIVEKHREWR